MNLNDLEKKNIYPVPPHYFDQLPQRIMMQVQAMPAADLQKPGVNRFYFIRTALASTVVLLLFTFVFLLKSERVKPPASGNMFNKISNAEALDYLLTSEYLETQDLSLLTQADTDVSHEFIVALPEEVIQELEAEEIEEFIHN